MSRRYAFLCAACLAAVCFFQRPALALDSARVGGDITRTLFGPGTGIIVGIVDSGILTTHSALSGTDSLGNPRLVAQANFVTSEPSNTGQDVYGHGTAVLGVIASTNPGQLGMAPDVRYINARVLDSGNGFSTDAQVVNGFGFAVSHGANIINASLNYFSVGGDASSRLSLLTDYLWDSLGIPVTVCANNNGTSAAHTAPGPADAFNVLSVASSQRSGNFNQIVNFSNWGLEANGLVRPDITAIGDSVLTTDKNGAFATWTGTSFASPQVAGMLATQMQYGRDHGLSTDTRVLRATLLNSAAKINDRNNTPWAPAHSSIINGVLTLSPSLDDNSGAGQISGAALVPQYLAGQQSPGSVAPEGWDLHSVTSPTASVAYTIDALPLPPLVGATLTATLTWNRHVQWTDTDGSGTITSADALAQSASVSNFDLELFRDNTLIAAAASTIDTIEQINWTITDPGTYSLHVERLAVAGALTNETYAIAWNLAPVPEPATLALLLAAVPLLFRRTLAKP